MNPEATTAPPRITFQPMPAPSQPSADATALTAQPEQTAAYHAGADAGGNAGAASDLACWPTFAQSADLDVFNAKEAADSRSIDLAQNEGFIAGSLNYSVAHIVGTGLKLTAQPDWRLIPGADEEWARETSAQFEAAFRTFVGSDRNSLDRSRRLNYASISATVVRSLLLHGEILATFEPRKNRQPGEQATAIAIVDPSRLSNPQDGITRQQIIKHGIEYNSSGEPVAYWISARHKRDLTSRNRHQPKMTWQRIARTGSNGRIRVFHAFDPERPEQSRGISAFASVLRAAKLVDRLSDATLQAAVMQSVVAMVVKSGADIDKIMTVVGADADGATKSGIQKLGEYQSARAAFYKANPPKLPSTNAKAIFLLPDEEIELKQAAAANPDVASFIADMRMETARSQNMSREAFSGDYSKTSYSSARVSGAEAGRVHAGRRERAVAPFFQWIYGLFIEEYLIRNPELLPRQADFWTNRDAIVKAVWGGPQPIEADPKKAAAAATARLANGTSSLAAEAALCGNDWEAILEQRAAVLRRKEELGLFEMEAAEAVALEVAKAKALASVTPQTTPAPATPSAPKGSK